jgi:hypothetical protein
MSACSIFVSVRGSGGCRRSRRSRPRHASAHGRRSRRNRPRRADRARCRGSRSRGTRRRQRSSARGESGSTYRLPCGAVA